MKNGFFPLSGNFFDGKWLGLSSIHTLKKKPKPYYLCYVGLNLKLPACCSGLQRRRWRSDVSRSDDRVHQQQAERPETQRDPLPASSSCTDSHSDGEVSAWQGTVGERWAQLSRFWHILILLIITCVCLPTEAHRLRGIMISSCLNVHLSELFYWKQYL